jgi:pyruvate/2-oxoglutarate dehydrogenase complex dihydrolipoamide acyltransferase (E2) component
MKGTSSRRRADMEILDFPLSRLGTFDVGVLSRRRNHMASFLEIDVSSARGEIRRRRREGEAISFTAWMLRTIAVEMAKDGRINAARYGRAKNMVLDGVDMTILVEKTVDGEPVPLPLVIRDADRKPIAEIYGELEDAKSRGAASAGEGRYLLGAGRRERLLELFYLLPQWLRVFLFGAVLKSPLRAREMMGSAAYTTVGNAGNAAGWILPRSVHSVCVAVGSINRKPWVRMGKIEIRDIMHLTVLIDHDIIDGAPAARFMSRLVRAIEGAAGL